MTEPTPITAGRFQRLTKPEQDNALVRTITRHPATVRVLDRHQQVAACTVIEAEALIERLRDKEPYLTGDELSETIAMREMLNEQMIYANAIAQYAAWLTGEEPASELAGLLDLEV